MRRASLVLWVAFAALAAVDFGWCRALGLSFTNWLPFLAAVGGIAAIGLIYGVTGRSARIAAMANGVLLWMVGSLLGAILTYAAAAAQGGPLYDAQFAALDAALGFDWTAWYRFVSAHALLKLPLALAYMSLLPQILLSVIWFSFRGWEHRNAELLCNFTLAIALTTAIFHLLPALGPCAGVPAFSELYVDQLVALRSGSVPPPNVMHLKGIVAFPSFHAVLAALFIYAHRGSPLFVPSLLLNAMMLISIPSEGGHYLVDVFVGAAIAGLSIRATAALAQWQFLGLQRSSAGPLRPEVKIS